MEKETLEEAALRIYQYVSENPPYTTITPKDKIEGFIKGAKYQAERMYSEEEVIKILDKREDYLGTEPCIFDYLTNKEWFEQFSKLKNG